MMTQTLVTLGLGVLLYGLGYQFGAWRAERRADAYVNRARARLVMAEQLCARAEQLLAKATPVP